jgi:hypothetical protein
MTQPDGTRVRTDAGFEYVDPDESLLFQLFLDVEERGAGQLTLERHSTHPGTRSAQLKVIRQRDRSYRIQEVENPGEVRESVSRNMAWAHDATCRWVGLGSRVTASSSATHL